MNFFEQQLRNLTGKNTSFKSTNPVFVGRACFITLSEGRRARMEFVTTGMSDRYEALQITLLNLKEGKIDTLLLRFADYFALDKPIASGGRVPHIWMCDGKAQWYGVPLDAEKTALTKAAHDYIMLFA